MQVCRYLSERLVEAWNKIQRSLSDSQRIQVDGELLQEDLTTLDDRFTVPRDPDDALVLARRLIADRCLYGVDCNPMAVEMAKLSLWLITMQRGRPFTFLDHAIKCGDSLIGICSLDQIRRFDACVPPGVRNELALGAMSKVIHEATGIRSKLETMPVLDICDIDRKQLLHQRASNLTEEAQIISDILIATTMVNGENPTALQQALDNKATQIAAILLTNTENADLRQTELQELRNSFPKTELERLNRRAFHWVIEFPEVFVAENGGFDAVIGNPPFMGGKKITGNLGVPYRNFLLTFIAQSRRGNADLCAYFVLRAAQLLKLTGYMGLITTNTISQGDTREVALDYLLKTDKHIYRAIKSQKWPGQANLEVSQIWMSMGNWTAPRLLDDELSQTISSYLEKNASVFDNKPARLVANIGKTFQGSIVLGMGFTLSPTEAADLKTKDERNATIILPYLSAEDLNSTPNCSATRYVINFGAMPRERSHSKGWHEASDEQQQDWISSGIVPSDYPLQVASDFPLCLEIVTRLVKPERDKLINGDVTARDYAKRWWQFGRRADNLYQSIASFNKVLVIPIVSKYLLCVAQHAEQVFSNRLVVIASDSDGLLALLQSSVHECWARVNCSTLRLDMKYAPSDGFENFPLPPTDLTRLSDVGQQYQLQRAAAMTHFGEGLTKIYNRFHDPTMRASEVQGLRHAHIEMDRRVLQTYGWADIPLDHEFRQTRLGSRFSISEECKAEILLRLFRLNTQRHQGELLNGPTDATHSKKKLPQKPKKKRQQETKQMTMDTLN